MTYFLFSINVRHQNICSGQESILQSPCTDNYIFVSTFGADKPLKDIVTKLPNKDKLSIKMVHKTAPSLKTLMCTPRRTCLGPSKGKTEKCGRRKCLCCNLILDSDCVYDQSGKSYKTAKGNCTTKNILYHLRCKICSQPNVGKTVQMASSRMCGHRSKYFEIEKTMVKLTSRVLIRMITFQVCTYTTITICGILGILMRTIK